MSSLRTHLSHPNLSISESALLGSRAWQQTLDRILTMFVTYVPHRFSQIDCPTKTTQASLSCGWFWSLVSLCRSLFWCRIPLNLSTHIELIWSHISSDHLISCLFLADSFPCGSSSLLPFCLVAEVSIVSELSTSWTFAQFIYATSKA